MLKLMFGVVVVVAVVYSQRTICALKTFSKIEGQQAGLLEKKRLL